MHLCVKVMFGKCTCNTAVFDIPSHLSGYQSPCKHLQWVHLAAVPAASCGCGAAAQRPQPAAEGHHEGQQLVRRQQADGGGRRRPGPAVGLPPAGLHVLHSHALDSRYSLPSSADSSGLSHWQQVPIRPHAYNVNDIKLHTCHWSCLKRRLACRASHGRAPAPARPASPTGWALETRPLPPCAPPAARTACCTAPAAQSRNMDVGLAVNLTQPLKSTGADGSCLRHNAA
jgi:hypothetical protein